MNKILNFAAVFEKYYKENLIEAEIEYIVEDITDTSFRTKMIGMSFSQYPDLQGTADLRERFYFCNETKSGQNRSKRLNISELDPFGLQTTTKRKCSAFSRVESDIHMSLTIPVLLQTPLLYIDTKIVLLDVEMTFIQHGNEFCLSFVQLSKYCELQRSFCI